MLLMVTLQYGGVSTAVVMCLLLYTRPRASLDTWTFMRRLAVWWCVISVPMFGLLVIAFAGSRGWDRLGIIFVYYPAWLVIFFPAFPALILLKLTKGPT